MRARVDPEKLRQRLSEWHFWIGIAYLGLALTVVGLVILFNRTAHEEATRTAKVKADSATQVGQCFTQVKNAPLTQAFLNTQEALIENGILSNQASLAASRPDDPLRTVRLASLARLAAAKENVSDLRALITKSTPTQQRCLKLAHTLGVDPTRYLPRKVN